MELFPCSAEERVKIQKIFNVNEDSIRKDLEILKEWLKKQPHLPQKFQTGNFLEQVLMYNKFSVEKTKKKIECHFSGKWTYYDLYQLLSERKLSLPSQNLWVVMPLPRLGPHNERIILGYCVNPDPTNYEMWTIFQGLLAMVELMLTYNYSNGLRFIWDMKNFTFDQFKKFDLSLHVRMTTLNLTCYSSRIHSTELLHIPSFFGTIFKMLKPIFKQKIVDRIKFHNDLKSLHQSLDPEYLPQEYGGTAGSCKEILGKLDAVYESHRDHFKDVINYKTDENLRVCGPKYDEESAAGTFKKLNVD